MSGPAANFAPMKSACSYRLIAPVAASIYLLAMLLPFFAVYGAGVQSDEAERFSLFGDKIIICTENGFALVSVDDLPQQKPHSNPEYACGLCVLAANGLANFMQAFDPAAVLSNAAIWFETYRRAPDFRFVSHAFPRALSRAPPID